MWFSHTIYPDFSEIIHSRILNLYCSQSQVLVLSVGLAISVNLTLTYRGTAPLNIAVLNPDIKRNALICHNP